MSARARAAATALVAADPAMAPLVERFGTVDLIERFRRRLPALAGDPFVALLRSIVGQQLSTASAEAIFGRLAALCQDDSPRPADILGASDAQLRTIGLSRRKVEYVRDLAARVEDQRLDLAAIDRLGDEEVIAQISAVRGLGRWSAELFLIFHLRRPDVFPAADLVLRHAIRDLDRLDAVPLEPQARERARRWQPQRSLAAAYLWESAAAGSSSAEAQPKVNT